MTAESLRRTQDLRAATLPIDPRVARTVQEIGKEFPGLHRGGIRRLVEREIGMAERIRLENQADPEAQDHMHGERAARLNIAAQIDPLTGLLNRRGLKSHSDSLLEDAEYGGQSAGLAIIDLDFFKDHQDIHGHEFGDIVLRTAARTLLFSSREDDLCSRFGGDEFVIVVAGIPEYGMPVMLDRLRNKVTQEVGMEAAKKRYEMRRPVTTSIGYAYFPQASAHSYPDLLLSADRALYQAKHTGRNRVIKGK